MSNGTSVNIVDRDGQWFVNRALFRFHDQDRGVNFEPGVPVQIKPTEWMKSQPLIVPVSDPFAPVEVITAESPKDGGMKAVEKPGQRPIVTANTIPAKK
jgi:hypothetical protein